MDIEKLIEDLQDALDSGQAFIPEDELVEMAYGKRAGDENRARKKIIYRIIRAKREAGFPRNCNFFDDVWSVALDALNRYSEEQIKVENRRISSNRIIKKMLDEGTAELNPVEILREMAQIVADEYEFEVDHATFDNWSKYVNGQYDGLPYYDGKPIDKG
jgi:hypothetical protein